MRCTGLSLCVAIIGVSGCSANPITTDDVRHDTGISLCQSTLVRDLTSSEERDTVPGFSFHVEFSLDSACESSFRKQLAELPTSSCALTTDLSQACYVEDAFPKAAEHTSIMVSALGRRTYDMRFYQ